MSPSSEICPSCGHPWVEHWNGHLQCMHSTPEKVWACDCEGDATPKVRRLGPFEFRQRTTPPEGIAEFNHALDQLKAEILKSPPVRMLKRFVVWLDRKLGSR